MICPFLVTISKNLNINPLITLGVIGLFGALACLPLSETFEKKLLEEIDEEIVAIGRGRGGEERLIDDIREEF